MGDKEAIRARRHLIGGVLQGFGLTFAVVAAWSITITVGLAALAAALFVVGWAVERSGS